MMCLFCLLFGRSSIFYADRCDWEGKGVGEAERERGENEIERNIRHGSHLSFALTEG